MGIEAALFAALKTLVANRVYPDTFPQDYQWPAIRYTFVSAVPEATVCGNGDDDTTEFRVQIDGVARTDVLRDALGLSIRVAMKMVDPPAICVDWDKSYDPETKAYRARLDYLLHPSSEAVT